MIEIIVVIFIVLVVAYELFVRWLGTQSGYDWHGRRRKEWKRIHKDKS